MLQFSLFHAPLLVHFKNSRKNSTYLVNFRQFHVMCLINYFWEIPKDRNVENSFQLDWQITMLARYLSQMKIRFSNSHSIRISYATMCTCVFTVKYNVIASERTQSFSNEIIRQASIASNWTRITSKWLLLRKAEGNFMYVTWKYRKREPETRGATLFGQVAISENLSFDHSCSGMRRSNTHVNAKQTTKIWSQREIRAPRGEGTVEKAPAAANIFCMSPSPFHMYKILALID